MATLPGVPLYRACGFETVEEGELTLTDGVKLEVRLDDEAAERVVLSAGLRPGFAGVRAE